MYVSLLGLARVMDATDAKVDPGASDEEGLVGILVALNAGREGGDCKLSASFTILMGITCEL